MERNREIVSIGLSYSHFYEMMYELLESKLDGVQCRGFGGYSALSFNGNKMITISGGGVLVVVNKEAKGQIMFYATQA